MGIKGLWKILENKHCCHKLTPHELRSLIRTEECRVSADAFHLCYKYFTFEWATLAAEGKYDQQQIITSCINRLMQKAETFRLLSMEMILCVDGDKSKDKVVTEKRSNTRNENYKKVIKLYLDCKHLLKDTENTENSLQSFRFLDNYTHILEDFTPTPLDPTLKKEEVIRLNINQMRVLLKGTVFFPKGFIDRILDELVSKGVKVVGVKEISEGEKLCSILVKLGYCQAVFSEDSDTILFGTRCVIRQISRKECEVYFYEEVLKKLEMNDKQFLSMCIGIGSDFSPGAPGLGPVGCENEVRNKDFDLQKFNLKYCGVPRVNVCVDAFRISEEEMKIVMDKLVFRKV